MSKVIVNKEKIRINLLIKFIIIFLLVILFTSIFYLFVYTNFKKLFFDNYFENISKKYDYVLKEVEITGLNYVKKEEINQYFLEYFNKSIFLLPMKGISKQIKEHNWIKSFEIKNDFKNKIIVDLVEFKPIAIYFNGSNYLLINNDGKVIDFAKNSDVEKYIIVTGEHAKDHVLKLIDAIPLSFKSIIKAGEYINNRRWNIYTYNDLIIKLPEKNYRKALESFISVYNDLSNSKISKIDFIDLRIPERVIIKLNNNSN